MAIVVQNLPADTGDIRGSVLVPGLGKSLGGGYDNLLQYSCCENSWTEETVRLWSLGLQRVGLN